MKGTIRLTRKLQKIGSSIAMVIPKQLAQLKGWSVGDTVEIGLNDKGDIIIRGK